MTPYDVRQYWERFKAAACRGGQPLVEAVARASIEKWASHESGSPVGPSRAFREALSASVAGAALVDSAIVKLAAQGRYTPEEREFLLDLNAQAAIGDLRSLLKLSSVLDRITGFVQQHPMGVGAAVGGLVGGSIGALKDDDNRARGALLYGVPGAAIGAVVGHGADAHWRELAEKEQAKMLATDDWNYALHEGREWAKLRDADHATSVRELAKVDPEYAPAALSLGGQGVPRKDQQGIVQQARAQMDAEAAQGARAAAQSAQAAAASRMQGQIENGKRLFNNLLQSAASFASGGGDPDEAFHAKRIYDALKANEKQIVEHAAKNPGMLHRSVIDAAGVGPGAKVLSSIHSHAKNRFNHGN